MATQMTKRDKIRQIIAQECLDKLYKGHYVNDVLSGYQSYRAGFLRDMTKHIGTLSEKQRDWLRKLALDALPFSIWAGSEVKMTEDMLNAIIK